MSGGFHARHGELRRHHPARENDVSQEERIDVGDAHQLHLMRDDFTGQFVVWLNTEVSDFDGLVLGLGDSRDAAIRRAVETLEQAVEALQGPPPSVVADATAGGAQ